jgi:hypothetical protein
MVSFEIPMDMYQAKINGEEDYWIRAKIDSGNYGQEEKKVLENGQEKTVHAGNLTPPVLNKIIIHYDLERTDLKECSIYNNYIYNQKVFDQHLAIKIFDQKEEKEQALYLCLDAQVQEDFLDVYFEIQDNIIENRSLRSNERSLVWEVHTKGKWHELRYEDDTEDLTRSGDIRLFLPEVSDQHNFNVNGQDIKGTWIRAKVKYNALIKIPEINRIELNSVIALQQERFDNELLGKSIGLPQIHFTLNHPINITQPPKILVGDSTYTYTKRFIDHDKLSKVFRFSSITGEVEFGDGKYGMIPPANENIVVSTYTVTQGKKGNRPVRTINQLRQAISYVASVENITPATGGADGDSIDTLIKYAPSVFKTRDRAVTLEDYESLAQDFSSNISHAKAVSDQGEVVVVIVTPDIVQEGGFINRKLINDLEEYLRSKSLVTVLPVVKTPRIVPINIRVSLKMTKTDNVLSKTVLEQQLQEEAKRYFDLFSGGDLHEGYPLGKSVTRADLYKILNNIDNSLYYHTIKLNDSSDKIVLDYDQVVSFEKFVVEEISFDA